MFETMACRYADGFRERPPGTDTTFSSGRWKDDDLNCLKGEKPEIREGSEEGKTSKGN